MHYLWWIPTLLIYYWLYAYVSFQNQTDKNLKWFILSIFMNIFGLWPIVSRISKNLIFDSILYDIIMTLSFTIGIIYLTNNFEFRWYNWMGLSLILIGLVLIKV